MPLIETNTEGLWVAKQSAKGTAASTAVKQMEKTAGDLNVNRDDGSVAFSDSNRFQDAEDYVLSIRGDGNPTVLGQPGVAAYLLYLLMGQEAVTGASDPYTHVITPGLTGFWSTWWKKVGRTVGPLRQKFVDARIISLELEASHQKPELMLIPKFVSLQSGETFSGDPVKVFDTDDSLLYTNGVGTFNIDGTVFQGHSQFTMTIGEGTSAVYGDDVTPFDIEEAVESIKGTCTLYVDSVGLAEYNQIIYGTPTPAPGAHPIKTVQPQGSYSFTLTQSANRSVQIELPGVHWGPDIAIAGQTGGKAATLAMKFTARTPNNGTDPIFRATIKNGDPAYT